MDDFVGFQDARSIVIPGHEEILGKLDSPFGVLVPCPEALVATVPDFDELVVAGPSGRISVSDIIPRRLALWSKPRIERNRLRISHPCVYGQLGWNSLAIFAICQVRSLGL